MKRRISDLVSGIWDDPVVLNSETPLSSRRIKERTMSKIRKEKKTMNGKRIAFRILVAAAAVSLMTMTALAAENIFGVGDWFRDVLNMQLEEKQEQYQEERGVSLQETLSEGQVAILNKLGKDFQPQTQKSGDATITMTAAYGYEYMMCMYFSVQAPEGTVLPDDILYTCYSRKDEPPLTVDAGAPYEVMGHQVEFIALPDKDPTDNEKNFYAVINAQDGMEATFSDGWSKHFHMTGLYEQVVDQYGNEDGFEPFFTGDFSFAIGTEVINIPWVELDVEGLSYDVHWVRTWTHNSPCLDVCGEHLTGETEPETGLPIHSVLYDYRITLQSMKISPYGVEAVSEDGYVDVRVIMKDGSSPLMFRDNCFQYPIDLSQVDYILLGNPEHGSTQKVYLPK